MNIDEFIATIQQQARHQDASMSWQDADQAARATLATLAERLSSGEARDLAKELPPEVRGYLVTDRNSEPFYLDEFIRRVAAREGVDVEVARIHGRAVLHAITRAVSPDELADVSTELPKDIRAFLG